MSIALSKRGRRVYYSSKLYFRKQNADFDICKRNLLLKLRKELDKSKKGSVDEPIIDLVNYLNRTHDFCTTSSCSGRFAVFCADYDEVKHEQVSVTNSSSVKYRKVVNGCSWSTESFRLTN